MPDLSLDLRHLRYALAASEHGSFRRAATALDISQSTLSRRIQLLERQLGFPLFVRDRRGAKLTATGSAFLEQAFVGAQQLKRAAAFASATHRGQSGRLRIGVLAALTSGYLYELLRRFRAAYPNVELVLKEGSPGKMLCSVARGELDVIFVTGAPDVTELASEKLWTESMFVVLPSTHALADRNIVSWDELSAETFVLNARGPGAEIEDYLIRMLARPGFRPKVEMHDVARDSLLTMVGMGFGITITSASSIRRELAGVVFLPIEGEKDALWSSAVWSKSTDDLLLKRFLEYASRFAASWNDSLSREGM